MGKIIAIPQYNNNWPLQPLNQDYGLASHVVCVSFIREWRDLQFNADSDRQIFEKLFHGRLIYSQRKSPKKYFFSYFVLTRDLEYEPGHTSNKPTHFLLDYGEKDDVK